MSRSEMTSSLQFATITNPQIPRSTFDRSHGIKTTMDSDYLVPIFLDEILPGDSMKLKANLFGRLATPVKPILDNLYLDTFFFFVPNRLLWDDWKKFMGEQKNPGDSTDFTIPFITLSTGHLGQFGTLSDYFGIPIGTMSSTIDVNILPYRAYWLCFDEWFRDQNLQNSASIATDSSQTIINNGVDYNHVTLAKRGKRHDYFTSCLPWTQKGDPVQVPLGTRADVTTNTTTGNVLGVMKGGTDDGYDINSGVSPAQLGSLSASFNRTSGGLYDSNVLYADLSNATGASINAWRQAFQIQRFMERDARGGTRYIEKVLSHFGVRSSDARMQRPEYLGGSSQRININPVAQTSSTDATSEQGNLSAFGTVSDVSGFTKSFEEHGYVIGLANVRADLSYSQGTHKLWSRSTQYDFYFPTFAHLGEQAVLSKEIYTDGSAQDNDVFGYNERYSEYRYMPSKITGKFRHGTGTLDVWHLAEEFSTRPTLSSTFIQSNTPLDRCVAVPSEPQLLLDGYMDYKCTRPMPVYAPPGMIDHF